MKLIKQICQPDIAVRQFLSILILGAGLLQLFSCGEMEDVHKEFIKDGEIVYPGKADSLKAHSGAYRLRLSWLLLADPSVKKAKIYWNNRADSLEVKIERSRGVDTVSVLIDKLQERSYTFEVYTFDAENNISVRSEVLGTAYGEIYRHALLNRVISKHAAAGTTLQLIWQAPEASALGQEITFKNKSGVVQVQRSISAKDTTFLENFDPKTPLTYRTIFLPAPAAIDTFYTDPVSVTVDPKLFPEKK
jgi:hypothetical protein